MEIIDNYKLIEDLEAVADFYCVEHVNFALYSECFLFISARVSCPESDLTFSRW
jgi:hypothetical protein